jgi:hypothetical protein
MIDLHYIIDDRGFGDGYCNSNGGSSGDGDTNGSGKEDKDNGGNIDGGGGEYNNQLKREQQKQQ